MHLPRFLAILFLVCLLSRACGQSVGQPPPTAATPAAQDLPILRSNTSLVLVDVVATEHGNAVHGLEQRQFHVFEDGREQTIVSFDEHRQPPDQAVAAKAAPLPPHVYNNIPLYAESSAVNVLLLDGLNTPMDDQMEVRRQMIRYLGKVAPGISLAIFTLSSRLRMVTGFTTDTGELVSALQNRKNKEKPSIVLDTQTGKLLDEANLDIANTPWLSPDAAASMLQFQADLAAFEVDQRVRMTLDAMEQLARYLSAIPGRKNLIWFSGSFPLALDPDDSLRSPFEAMRSYTSQMREAAELLAAARVAVYPVDARGLINMPGFNASYSGATPMMAMSGVKTQGLKNAAASPPPSGPAKENKNFLRELQTSQAGMMQIAEQTGGHATINTNGLKEAVAEAVENGSNYYTIGYLPTDKDYNGQFRKIHIRMDSGSYALAYRQGYYADPPDKPSANLPGVANPMTSAILHGAPPATEILLQARVLPAADPVFQGAQLPNTPGEMAATLKKPVYRFVVDLVVDARSLTFQQMPDGAHQTRMELALVAYDAEGKRLNYLNPSYAMKIQPAQFPESWAKGIRLRLTLDLPSGQDSLRIAVRDVASNRTGALEVPLAVAAQ
ncbi:MAG: VWA domain-containing protein [Terracidiphilus sp.]